MTTKTVKALTPSEMRKLQERAERAAQQAQELDDATFLALAEVHHAAEVALLKDRLTSAMEDASHIEVSELKDSFTDAQNDLARAKQQEAEAVDLKNMAQVIMSRRAFQASVHPAIVGSGKQNISKAGEALGMPYSTIRPYVLAGGALFQHDRAFLLSVPDAEDSRIVNESFNSNSRRAQIEKRQRAAAKQQAQDELLAKQAAEIEALKQAQNGNGQAPAAGAGEQQAGEQAPAGEQQAPAQAPAGENWTLAEAAAAQAPAHAEAAAQLQAQAPAQAQQAGEWQANPEESVSANMLAHARKLVAQAKFLRKEDKAEWARVVPELKAQLAQVFPELKQK